jgi:hypothetical protein
MPRKPSKALTVRSRRHVSAIEFRALAREATVSAAARETEALGQALDLIESAERFANDVVASTASELACTETRAAAISLTGAAAHLRAAVEALGRAGA